MPFNRVGRLTEGVLHTGRFTKCGVRDIWTVPADGGEAVPVTDDAFVDWNPVWSFDGKYLYFSSDRGGSFNLWRIRLDEDSGDVLGTAQSVTTGGIPPNARTSNFRRTEAAWCISSGRGSANIWKVAIDPNTGTVEGEPQLITFGTRQVYAPDVSPDGLLVGFLHLCQSTRRHLHYAHGWYRPPPAYE